MNPATKAFGLAQELKPSPLELIARELKEEEKREAKKNLPTAVE